MDIKKVLMEYDGMFGKRELKDIDQFLEDKIDEANREQDYYSLVSLLNEHMGFCRDTSQKEKGLKRCGQVISMLNSLGLNGTLEYATSLINVANAYRAFGEHDKSLKLFNEVEVIYNEKLAPTEYNFASLYNNWSLLYQEMGYYEQAVKMLKKALKVIDGLPQAVIQQAVTRSNLAMTLLRISKAKANEAAEFALKSEGIGEGAEHIVTVEDGENEYKDAMTYLMEALKIFEENGANDFHYSAALSAMGDALYMKEDYAGAIPYYEHALSEIEKNVGQTDAYQRVYQNYQNAKQQLEFKNKAFAEKLHMEQMKQAAINEEFLKETRNNDVKEAEIIDDTKSEAENTFTSNPHILNNNMERCKAFYERYGALMIHKNFPDFEDRIAVGLVGEGSDCFGYDDTISMDHDYGVGFCMWLTDADYERIGAELQAKYENLVASKADEFMVMNKGAVDRIVNKNMDGRRGAMRISEFYENILGVRINKEAKNAKEILSEQGYLFTTDENLATVTNGMLFRDDLGEFKKIRESLKAYYPQKVWMLKLAKELHNFAQYAQSNYARMMVRKDYVTANLCVAKGMESAMQIAYLLNKKYAPYYKWMQKGLLKLNGAVEINNLIQDIAETKLQRAAWAGVKYNPYVLNKEDRIVCLFEEIAQNILNNMKIAGLVEGDDTFLDSYVDKLLNKANGLMTAKDVDINSDEEPLDDSSEEEVRVVKEIKVEINSEDNVNNSEAFDEETDDEESDIEEPVTPVEKKPEKAELVDDIVILEWKQFDKVKNEGGRADCQDDWNTFSLMRRSQYRTWPEELLASYRNDLIDANIRGWNMISEKYARMMKSTAPEKYYELVDTLPVRSEGRIDIQEEIVKIQVEWMEEFAKKYPKMAGNARSIHTEDDNAFNTSYETYLRGELGTYSEETFILYGRFIIELKKSGDNLAYMIMNNTAKAYGYENVDDAESKL